MAIGNFLNAQANDFDIKGTPLSQWWYSHSYAGIEVGSDKPFTLARKYKSINVGTETFDLYYIVAKTVSIAKSVKPDFIVFDFKNQGNNFILNAKNRNDVSYRINTSSPEFSITSEKYRLNYTLFNAGGEAPLFSYGLNNDSLTAIKLLDRNTNTEYFYIIAFEKGISRQPAVRGIRIPPQPLEFKPYQEIEFTNSPYCEFAYDNVSITSERTSVVSSGTKIASYQITKRYGEEEFEQIECTASFSNASDTKIINITEWDEKQIECVRTTSGFKLYSGVKVGSDFLNAYQIKVTKSNEYHSKVSYPQTSLELSRMSATIPSENSSSFSFNYDVSDITPNETTSLTVNAGEIIKLASGEDKFGGVSCQVVWELADEISDSAIYAGGLTYEDGSVVPFTEYTVISSSKQSSLGSLPYVIGNYTPNNFTIRYDWNIAGIGTLSKEFDCIVGNSHDVASVVLEGEKNNFNADDIIEFGVDATVDLLDVNGDVLTTISSSDFNLYFKRIDEMYGKRASLYATDKELKLKSFLYGFEIEQRIAISYYDDKLTLNTNLVQKDYMIDNDFEDFDYDGLVISIKKHNNAIVGRRFVSNIDEEFISLDDVTISHSQIDYLNKKEYTITVHWNDEYGISHSSNFTVFGEPLVPSKIFVDNAPETTHYYDNGVDVFKYPTGLNVFIQLSNGETIGTVDSLANIRYFRDKEKTIPLSAGSSVISKGEGNSIYMDYSYTYEGVTYTLDGFYNIVWETDDIEMVVINNETAVQLFYGNRLERYKDVISLECVYTSGAQRTMSSDEYQFENSQIIMSEPTNIRVRLLGIGTFTISNLATSIVWNNPECSLSAKINNIYCNGSDIIYPNQINVTAKYYDDDGNECDYKEALEYTETSLNYGKFSLTGSGKLNGYVFGSQILDVDMEGGETVYGTMTVASLNRFTLEQASTSVSAEIRDVKEITGIKIVDPTQTYYVGERFLNDEDETKCIIFYNNSDNEKRSFTISLKNEMSVINVYPVKGTLFNSVVPIKEISVSSVNNTDVFAKYSLEVKAKTVNDTTKRHQLVAVFLSDYECPDGVSRSKYFLINKFYDFNGSDEETTQVNASGEREIKDGLSIEDVEVFGYLDDIENTEMNARLILFEDYISPIEGSNNITVKYPCYVEGNADLINKSHFGIMFGSNNSRNRLFVSGNPDYKNKDWHSSEVDSEYVDTELANGNYGYFEDLSECVYGETDNEVIGYDIVSNDKLLVLKSKSDKETTIYFRQPQLVTAINGSGTSVSGIEGETLYQEEFSVVKGNNSVAGVNPKSIFNFNGDTVFISDNKQLVGLDLTGIIGDNQRYANSRSYYIDEELKNQDLSKCFVWSDNSYLFIVLPKKIYVTHYELKSETQYEWFVLDIEDVTSVCKINDVIYLGNSKGELFKFSKEYKDALKLFVGYGTTKISMNAETEILISREFLGELEDDKTYFFKPIAEQGEFVDDDPYIYYRLGDIQNNSSADCEFYVNNSDYRNVIELVCIKDGNRDNERLEMLLKRISEKEPVYFNHLDNEDIIQTATGSSLANAWGKPYWLREYSGEDATQHLYQVIDENGNVVPIRELWRATLCVRVTKEFEMTEIDKDNGTFKLKSDGDVLDLVQYNKQSLNIFKGEIVEYKNVEAFYITKPYDMGNLEYLKTVWSFTLTNDSNIPSEFELCYANNKIPLESMKTLAKISKDVLGFDIETFNFAKVDFDKNVVPRTYTNKRILSGVKFLCFGFRNLNDTNSVLSSLTVTYTLPYPSYGSD